MKASNKKKKHVGAKRCKNDSLVILPGFTKFNMTIFTLVVFEGHKRGADQYRWIRTLVLSALRGSRSGGGSPILLESDKQVVFQ